MVRECVSRSVREIEKGGTLGHGTGREGGGGRERRRGWNGERGSADLDTYVSTRAFETAPRSDV